MITRLNPSSLFPSLSLAAAIAMGLLACASVAYSQASVTVLHSFFGNATDGGTPLGGLIQASDGTLWGTTWSAPDGSNHGTIFQMAPDGGGYAVLHNFAGGTDGQIPYAGLIQASDGMLWGTSFGGDYPDFGTIFQIAPNGSGYTVLHNFAGSDGADGANPIAGLIQADNGLLYGTTEFGASINFGTIFQIGPGGSGYTVLYRFMGGLSDGAYPYAGLIQASDGMLYGTTRAGGTSNAGTIFRIAPDGSDYRVLHNFAEYPADTASNPHGELIQASDGMLYGTTYSGGDRNVGTIFRMALDGSGYAVLRSFAGGGADGAYPGGSLIQTSDGMLYGTTQFGGDKNVGTVFRMALDGSGYTVLQSFTGWPADGANPWAGLIQASDGTLYGTTLSGGAYHAGVVFQLTF